MTASIATDLPEPDSPTIARTSPRLDVSDDAVDGAKRADAVAKVDGEVADLEERHLSSA